jgi:hypothetical protein
MLIINNLIIMDFIAGILICTELNWETYFTTDSIKGPSIVKF